MTSNLDVAGLKRKMKASWMAGDFGKIAPLIQAESEAFVSRLQLKPGMKVLDVGCGTGNQSIPAARAGAHVTGVDIAPNLLEQARAWALREGLNVDFREADAEELPFHDAAFDVVMSMFAAMFAPRPKVVAAELIRACRPGGLIALASWTPDSLVAARHEISSRYSPPPPGLESPMLWSNEAVVRERFGDEVVISTIKRTLTFDIPLSPDEASTHFSRHSGSNQLLLQQLDAARREAFIREMAAQFRNRNRGHAAHTLIDSDYLEVHARRV